VYVYIYIYTHTHTHEVEQTFLSIRVEATCSISVDTCRLRPVVKHYAPNYTNKFVFDCDIPFVIYKFKTVAKSGPLNQNHAFAVSYRVSYFYNA